MCGSTDGVIYTVTLTSTDRQTGDTAGYTVPFPSAIANGKYRCAIRFACTTPDTTQVYLLDMRTPSGSASNKTSGQRSGFACVTAYSNLMQCNGEFMLDCSSGAPPTIDVYHTVQSTGARATGLSEHVILMTMTPL